MNTTRMRTRRRASVGLVAVLTVLGLVACGDDDGDATSPGQGNDTGTGQAEGPGSATGGSDTSADECTRLETSEVEAQFGESGPVADPYVDQGGGCIWEIGDQEGFGEPEGFGDFFGVNTFRGDTSMSLEDTFGDPGGSIDGIGDEVWLADDASMLVFRHGDLHVSLTTSLGDEIDDPQGKMTALAELIFDRL